MWHTVWIQTRVPDLGLNWKAHCVKLFGPRSDLTFCLVWSGSKLFIMFIKVISCCFYLVSNSINPDQDRHFVKTVYGGVQRSPLFSAKWSRSRPIFWWAWSGAKLFIKVSALFQSFCEVFTFLFGYNIMSWQTYFFSRHQDVSGAFLWEKQYQLKPSPS